MTTKTWCCVIGMVLLLAPRIAIAEEANPCDGITCSGHGRCVVIRGEPGCACEEGHVADELGLNCYQTDNSVAQEAPEEPRPARILSSNAPGFRTWLAGTVLELLGAAVAIAGSAIWQQQQDNLCDEPWGCEEYSSDQHTAGQIMTFSGAGLSVVGVVLSIVGVALARRHHEQAQRGDTSAWAWTLLAAPLGESGGMFGIAGRF